MKKTFSRWGSKAMVFCLGASVFLAAAPVQTFAADQMYTITYRPGRIGTFTSELEDRYEEYAQANGGSVSVSDKTGNIKLELPAGTEYPAAPRQDEIQIKDEYDGKYVISTDWMPATGSVVTESEDYVVDYEALVNGVTYRIEFVDAESSQQVAPPIIAQGNVDQWVTYAAAQRIDTYQLDTDQPEGIQLTQDGENTLTFTYTDTNVNVVEVPGDVITEEVTVPGDNVTVVEEVPGTTTGTTTAGTGTTGTGAAGTGTTGTGAAGTGTGTAGTGTAGTAGTGETGTGETGTAGTGAEGTTEDGTTTIEDEDVPLAENPAGDETGAEDDTTTADGEDGTTTIEDEEVPQANADVDGEDSGISPGVLFGVTAGVVVVAAAVAAIILKKKRSGR